MKLKVAPEDFLVEEVSELPLRDRPGAYAVFRLEKTSWDTFDLLAVLARRLGVERRDVAVGGIKDRHGRTSQLVSVRGWKGSARGSRVRERNFTAELAGWSDTPLSARAVAGNRFSIVLRDLDAAEGARCLANLEVVRRDGVPNYYDEQRFGSARHGEGFMGRELFLGQRERALRLWFTPSKHDDRRTRALKETVIASWGRWRECLPAAFGEYARVLGYLAEHPRAFRQALLRLDRRFLVFVLNAYQSFLFNELLADLLRRGAESAGYLVRELRYGVGSFAFPVELAESERARLERLVLPVAGHDTACADPEVRDALEGVLVRQGIALSSLRARQLPRVSAHGVQRRAYFHPQALQASGLEEDDRYPGRSKLSLSFTLPRGCYATILVKRLGLAVPAAGSGREGR